MASPEDHDDLSLFGRIIETLHGATFGLMHAGRLLSIGQSSGVSKKFSPPIAAKYSGSKEMLTMPERSVSECQYDDHLGNTNTHQANHPHSPTTFIYEQCTIDGNQYGSLRALGFANEIEKKSKP